MEGFLRMLQHEGTQEVRYTLVLVNYKNSFPIKELSEISTETQVLELSGLQNKRIRLVSNGMIRCLHCATSIKKSYNQGYCYNCFLKLARNDLCILKPEMCHFHKGTCREPDWGKQNCFQKHTVYLANSSGLKVGITKEKPITNRWVDQGAVEGLAIIETNSRLDAGLIECEFKKYISDKTSWQKMISSKPDSIDLEKSKNELFKKIDKNKLPKEIKILTNSKKIELSYPISQYPSKKKSLKLQKDEAIEDIFLGVKGQYLLFQNGGLNIRSHAGYYCQIKILDF